MAHSKTIQLFRNTIIVGPDAENNLTALEVAKDVLNDYGSTNDGEVTLIRYQENNNEPVKTLVGIYHDDGSSGSWTYLTEFNSDDYYTKEEINDNEYVIASWIANLDERTTELSNSVTDINNRFIIEKVNVSTTGNVTQALDRNKFYIFNNVTTLSLTLNDGEGLSIYAGKFTANSNGCTMVLPSGVTIADGAPTIEGGETYEFNIADNVLILFKV